MAEVNRLSSALNNLSLLFSIMSSSSNTSRYVDNINIHSVLLDFNSKTEEQVFFIQIGANDGTKKDATTELIKQFNWKGILVEPVLDYFKKLQLYSSRRGLRIKA